MTRLTEQDIKAIFARLNAIYTDSHFVYTSGKHGPHYVDKDSVGLDPETTHHLAYELAQRLCEQQIGAGGEEIIAVVGAPMGAIRLADSVAYWINKLFPRDNGVKVRSIYADKDGDGLVIRRGFPKVFELGLGRGAFLIEDILNTGKSAAQLRDAVERAGGVPCRLGALCNRGGNTAQSLGVPGLVSLLDLAFEAFTVEEMPDWLKRRPVRTDLGHGAKWLETESNRALAEEWLRGQ